MSSMLLSALDNAEKNPTCGYKVGLFSSTAASSSQGAQDRSNLHVSDSTTVIIADDSSNSPSPVKRSSPVKSTPESSPQGRERLIKSPLFSNLQEYHSSQSSLESESDKEVSYSVDVSGIADSSSTEETSPTKGGTSHKPRENGGSPRGRGRGKGKGRGRGRGRGKCKEQGSSPSVDLKEKMLKGNAIGSNLVGITLSTPLSKRAQSVTEKNSTLFKGRQWIYTTPLERVSNQASSSTSIVPQVIVVRTKAADSTVDIPSGTNSPTFKAQEITHRARRGGNDESSDVESMDSSKEDSSSSSSSFKFLSTPTNSGRGQKSNSLKAYLDNAQRFNSYQIDKEQKVITVEKKLLSSSNEKSARGRGRGRGSVKKAELKVYSGKKLSDASKQSLAALSKNGVIAKSLKEKYQRMPDNTLSQRSLPLKQSVTTSKVQLTEVDSTINIPSDDESKKTSDPSEREKQEREEDTIDLLSDKQEENESEASKMNLKYSAALCPVCGIGSTNLEECTRCKTDFSVNKPKKYKISTSSNEVIVCSKCGKMVTWTEDNYDEVDNAGQAVRQSLICGSCKPTDNKANKTVGTKEFYDQKLNAFRSGNQSANTNNSVNKTFGTKEFFGQNVASQNQFKTLSLRSKGKRTSATVCLPNKRNKGRTKNAEPECISLLDSDEDEETSGSDISQTAAAETSSLLNGQKETRKNKMRDQTGNYVDTSIPNRTLVALTVSPQGVKPVTPTVAVTTQVVTQPNVGIPGSAASNIEFPGVAWDEETKTVTFDIVLLGFGSKRFMGHPPRISMSPAEIKFHFTTVEHGCAPVTLLLKEIEELHYGLCKSMPAIFIESTPAFALTARSRMNMKRPAENFDPHSKEIFEKYLFFRPHDACFTSDLSEKMKNIIMIMCQDEPKTRVFKELKNTEINVFLGQCTPPDALARCKSQQSTVQRRVVMSPMDQNRVGSTSTPVTPNSQRNSAVPQKVIVQSSTHVLTQSSPNNTFIIVPVQSIQSPVVQTNTGPPVRLITFPPPPAIGGVTVTSEDMECLKDGEFLNDVIIEFYLKYLLEEKLSAQDRQRTHIFSSFFYKRLTQREYGTNVGSSSEDVKLTPKEKRHQKVSKWTRKVDLFKKDFIVIPINESSHWYVAFICFPSRVQNTSTSPASFKKQDEEADSDAFEEDGEPMDVSERKDDAVDDQSGILEGEESKMDVDEQGCEEMETKHKNSNEQATSTGTDTPVKLASNEKSSLEEGEEGSKTNGGQSSSSSAIQEDTTMQDASKDDDDVSYSLHQRIKQELPCILIMDSLKTSPKRHVMQKLREYLDIEWQTRKKTKCLFTTQNMKGAQLDVPQQSNFSDCGIFVLQYVEQFFKKPIRNFSTPIKGLGNWFPQSEVKAKRSAITQLIMDLKEKQSKSKAATT